MILNSQFSILNCLRGEAIEILGACYPRLGAYRGGAWLQM